MNASPGLSRGPIRCTALMAVATLLACSVTVDSQGGTQNAALIDRLPAGATAIGWVDFEALAAAVPAEKWDEYEGMFQRDEDMHDLERFAEATGIDMREDMKQVAVAVMPGDPAQDGPLVLVHVLYDEARLMELFADAETRTYGGVTMYAANDVFRDLGAQLDPEQQERAEDQADDAAREDERPGYLAMLDERTLALGSEAGMEIIIDVDAGRRDALKADTRMNSLISDVAGQGQIWFVSTRDAWSDEIDDLESGGSMVPTTAIESIEVVTLSVRMGDGMAMRLAGIAGSAEDATLLADTLRGWMAMGKMALQQNEPELFDILDRGISVGQDDRTVHIDATLNQADIDVLRRLAAEQMQAGDVIGSGS